MNFLIALTISILPVVLPATGHVGPEPPEAEEHQTKEAPQLETKSAPEPKWEATYTITAYTAGPESTGKSPGQTGYGITASGEPVQTGLTIACPPQINLYTKIEIEGIGTRTCHDRGSAIKGNKLDLYIPDLQEAIQFGRQERRIKINAE